MAEIRKSFASDAAAYAGGIDLRDVPAGAADALYGVLTNKKAARPAAITKTAVTSADISAKTASAVDIGNSMHVSLNPHFTTSTGSITLALAKYDSAATPVLIGLTDEVSFTAQGVLTAGAGGKYVSSAGIFDVGDASWVEPVVLAINDTSVDIYMTVL